MRLLLTFTFMLAGITLFLGTLACFKDINLGVILLLIGTHDFLVSIILTKEMSYTELQTVNRHLAHAVFGSAADTVKEEIRQEAEVAKTTLKNEAETTKCNLVNEVKSMILEEVQKGDNNVGK